MVLSHRRTLEFGGFPVVFWQPEVIDVIPEPGWNVALALDGAGEARVLYHDLRLNALRLHREEESRPIAGASLGSACGASPYQASTYFKGRVKSISTEIVGMEWFTQGDGITTGNAGLDLPASLAATVRVQTAEIETAVGDKDLVELCGGEFDVATEIGASDFALRIEGPPVFVSRDGGARYGRPALGFPTGRGKLEAINLRLGYRGANDVCQSLVETHNNEIRRRVATALREPKGALRLSLGEIANTLNRTVAAPLLDEMLDRPWGTRGGSRGVSMRVGADGKIRVIHEETP